MDNTQEVTAVEPHRHTTRRMRPPHYIEGRTVTDIDLQRMLDTEAAEAKSKKFVRGLMLASAVVILVVLSSGVSLLYGMKLMASFGTTRSVVVSVPTDYYGPGEVFVRVPKGKTSGDRVRVLNQLLDELISDPVSLKAVRQANPDLNLDRIAAGTVIRVPVPVAIHSEDNLSPTNVIRQETTEFPALTLGDWFGKNNDWRDETHVW